MSNWPAPPRGPWKMVLDVLTAPWTVVILLVWLALRAFVGLEAVSGSHPAEWVGVRLPAIVLAFAFIGRAWRAGFEPGRLVWGLGLLGFIAALALSGGESGSAVVGETGSTEHYQRELAGRAVSVHLGGQLRVQLDESGDAADLWLGVGTHVIGSTRLDAHTGAEAQVGPWAMHITDIRSGDEPAFARLRVTPRKGGDSIELKATAGEAYPLPDNGQLQVLRLNSDFLGLLGSAAQLAVTWSDGQETAWHFVESKDLDARNGQTPYNIELVAVESAPRISLGVRRAEQSILMLAALVLLAFGLLLGFRRGLTS